MTPKKTLKKWFSNLMKPAQEHFAAWIDSYWHKSESIPMSNIEGLSRAIENTVSAKQLLNHLEDTNAHRTLFDQKVDKEDGKGLSANDFTNEHKEKLEGLQPTDTSGLLPKGGYDGTGQHLKEAIDGLQTKMQQVETTLSVDDTSLDTLQEIVSQVKDNKNLETLLISKVDKEDGKGLSANDFTNEHKDKLEGLQPTDTSGLLPKGGYDGTGQELKEAIDGLQTKMQQVETTLSVDDTAFDTLQEIATQVKNNKDLATIINGKMDKDEFFEKLKQLFSFFENSQISISNPLGRMDISSKSLYIHSSEELLKFFGKGVDIVSGVNIALETNQGIYLRGSFGQGIVQFFDVYAQDVNFRGDDSMNANISGYKTISLTAQDSINFNAQTVRVNGNSLTTLFEDFQNMYNKVADLENRISSLESRPAGYP
nr:MAG TPA: hypothetical protein [Caudoviricetes sp.]DAX96387.1 MAG TPA: hypothetical protein [Caudoviricetes sp.]